MKLLTKKQKKEYAGSIVLGLNDAIVEVTGALLGLTFVLQNTKLIAATGFIVGIAASLSMAASAYLHEREEGKLKPFKSASYTGIAYLITVILLIFPYILLNSIYASVLLMLVVVIIVIAVYSYYISNIHSVPFKTRFFRMVLISLTVAAISFAIGAITKKYLGIGV